MIISDNLSRLPDATQKGDVPLDLQIAHVEEHEDDHIELVDLINFGSQKREDIQNQDPTLRALRDIISVGWPQKITEVPTELRPYWSFRDEMGIADGIIFKGEQVLIPPCIRTDILSQLHVGHMGIERT